MLNKEYGSEFTGINEWTDGRLNILLEHGIIVYDSQKG